MKTELTTDAAYAGAIIRRGGLVAFATETVYGLGADAFNEVAVANIFTAKKRPADNPLIAHISRIEQIDSLASAITNAAAKLIDAFFPGPLTVILPKKDTVPAVATAGLNSIGIRMPRLGLTELFLTAAATPVVAPSANLSGRPSPTTWQAVLEDLDGRIDCILQGPPCIIGLESTVVDCTGEVPVLLRKGCITAGELRKIVPDIVADSGSSPLTPKSPGLKHKHYSPRAKVIVVKGSADDPEPNSALIGLTETKGAFEHKLICRNVEEYAHSLFEFYRECDRLGIDTIYCESIDDTADIGAALMDRIERAAKR